MHSALQVVERGRSYQLVMKSAAFGTTDALGDPPPRATYREWEEMKYSNLAKVASWFEHLPERGFFAFEGRDYDFGTDSGRYKTIELYGSRVYNAWEWLQRTMRERGWPV